MRSATARDLTRASEQLADTAEKAVSDAWEKWTQEQLQGVGTAAQVLAQRALSRGPFAATIEKARAARKQLQGLSQRDLPTDADVRAFAKQRAVLEAANAKIEQEVENEYRTTLVECALPERSPADWTYPMVSSTGSATARPTPTSKSPSVTSSGRPPR